MHPDAYKRPLFIGLVLFIVCLWLFYKPAAGPDDPSRFVSSKEPVCAEGQIESFAVSKKNSRNVILNVSSVNGQRTRGNLYARIKNFEPLWKDGIRLCGKIKKPYGIDMPGNFDWREYLAVKHVFAEISADGAEVIRPANRFYRAVRFVRADILQTFYENFNVNLAGIAGGVLLGERGEIDPALYTAFQDSGAIHLLVASGGNVGFVTLVVFGVCSLFGFGRKRTAWLALAVAGVYTLIAGADAPLTRAYFMTVCACAGYMLGRNSGVFQGLVLSCLVILCFNPAAVFETGFQMSFLATLAIVVCLNNYKMPYNWPKGATFFLQIFLATLSTQLILLPVFTNVFYKVSVTGLLSNMLLVPMASFVMGLTFLFYLFTLLKIGFLLKGVTFAALWTFQYLVEFFAGFKLSSLQAAAMPAGWIVSFYALVFLAFHVPVKTFFRKIWIPCVAVAVLAPAAQYFFFTPNRAYVFGEWDKRSVLIRAKSGETVLIGAKIPGEKLARAVLGSGSRTADAVLLFTDHPKERAGLEELNSLLRVRESVVPFKEGLWPGDSVQAGSCRIEMVWGEHVTKDGRRWTSRGYCGNGKDSVSYRVLCGGKELLAGADGRFVKTEEAVLPAALNQSIRVDF